MKLIRDLLVAWAVAAAATAVAVYVWRRAPAPGAPAITTTDAGPTVETIRELSALTTLRVDVADALVSELRGHTGATRAMLVVRGDVTLAVDLGAAKFEKVDKDARTAVLRLPPPRVQAARVDHERTRLLAVGSSGLWAITPGGGDAEAAAINRAYRDAQRIVAATAADRELADRARRQAESVVRQFLAATGWEVTIVWSD